MGKFVALLLAGLVLSGAAYAASPAIDRVNGEVSAANFPKLTAFLQEAFDKVVGLKVSFPANDVYQDGVLFSAPEEDGLFSAYVPGPDMDTALAATGGYGLMQGGYVFDGFFLVKYGGLNQGITSISLVPVDEATVYLSGAEIKEHELNTLTVSQ